MTDYIKGEGQISAQITPERLGWLLHAMFPRPPFVIIDQTVNAEEHVMGPGEPEEPRA